MRLYKARVFRAAPYTWRVQVRISGILVVERDFFLWATALAYALKLARPF